MVVFVGFIYVIKNFAVGAWSTTLSNAAILAVLLSAIISVTLSKFFDIGFSLKVAKSKKFESLEIELIDRLGEYYLDKSDVNYHRLFVIIRNPDYTYILK